MSFKERKLSFREADRRYAELKRQRTAPKPGNVRHCRALAEGFRAKVSSTGTTSAPLVSAIRFSRAGCAVESMPELWQRGGIRGRQSGGGFGCGPGAGGGGREALRPRGLRRRPHGPKRREPIGSAGGGRGRRRNGACGRSRRDGPDLHGP